MQETKPVLWSHLTWPEIEAIRGRIALFPVGATEQHGPHLGTGVDFVLAEKVCHRVSALTQAIVLPTLPYGSSLGHSRFWPGTLSLNPQTLTQLVTEVLDWAYASGMRRFLLVNGHVTNFAPLRCALEVMRSRYNDLMIAITNLANLSPRVQAEFNADAADWHANAAETSLIMSQAPELHRESLRKGTDDPDRTEGLVFTHPVNRTSLNGVTGYPSRASLRQGEQLFEWIVEDLVALVKKGISEQPPLHQLYEKPI